MSDIPSNAEVVSPTALIHFVERPSRFVEGVKAIAKVLTCPSCSENFDDPGAHKTVKCSCGLSMRWQGDWHIWRDEKVSA